MIPDYDREAHGKVEFYNSLVEEIKALKKKRWTQKQILVAMMIKFMLGNAIADYDKGVNPRHKNFARQLFKACRYCGVSLPQDLKAYLEGLSEDVLNDEDEGYGRPVVNYLEAGLHSHHDWLDLLSENYIALAERVTELEMNNVDKPALKFEEPDPAKTPWWRIWSE